MRALLQRVNKATVSVGGREIAAVGRGLLVLVGVFTDDDETTAQRLAERTLAARVFPDDAKLMNRSVVDIGGAVLVVSQFTLAADTSRGNRPGFGPAASPEMARRIYDHYVECLRETGTRVAVGEFGADMQVALVNDGPVTILLDAP